MTQQDIISILIDILSLSKRNRIRWTNTSTDAQFMTTLGDASITIDEFNMNSDSFYYTLSIYNSNGSVIYSYDTTLGDNETISSLIEKIYKVAENLFYKRDETFQSLKNTLSALKGS